MKKIKKIIWDILNFLHLAGPIQLIFVSSLKEKGWFKSFRQKQSIDKFGNPIPWFTYSSINFLETRLKTEFDVFEYGSGNSSLWFAMYCNTVTAVEHDMDWYQIVKTKIPTNINLIYYDLYDEKRYVNSILEMDQEFHLIIIDGRYRNECTIKAISKLRQDGIIIFDNSDRDEYTDSHKHLEKIGFSRIDFWGIGPIVTLNSCTSIFYRKHNCLKI
ncbi:MAG: FkbM family methyltransferase [Ignavibacteriae bacterium]|nr:FkbM family methyltransferase [Ignavibacteriota bacterium]